MPDELDIGDGVPDGLSVVAAVVFFGAVLFGCHALLERLRGKDKTDEIER